VNEETKFQRKLREKREREAAETARRETSARVAEIATSTWADDLIPGEDAPRADTDAELDRLVKSITIIEAYHKWCGKMRVDRRRKVAEGIKVSCPIPGHRDANPSAWLNTDKNLFYCGRCGQGGDVYDLAAFHFGMPVPGYKEGGQFHELRKKIAQSYGYTFMEAPGLDRPMLVPPEKAHEKPVAAVTELRKALGEKEIIAKASGEGVDKEESAKIYTDLVGEEPPALPTLDWRKLCKEGTFLDTYMHICIEDDAPEEYHFWNGLLALGLAVGRDVSLDDQKRVLANLFVCLLGPTGDGKSRSHSHVEELLFRTFPYKPEDITGRSVDVMLSPASAEVLISAFVNPIIDPLDPKKIAGYAPVRGLIEFNELSSLVGRASRKGNVLKPTLMELYDGARVVQTMSMTHGKKRAENPFGSLFTTAQPKALRTLLQDDDASSGFLNRIVFATATPKPRIPIGGKRIEIDAAIEPLRAVQGWAGFGRVVSWSDESVKVFTEFFHKTLYPIQQADDTGLLNRMDLLIKKLILLLCINEHSGVVEAQHVEKVIDMLPYLTAAYGVPAIHIGSTINSDIQDELLKHINRHSAKGGITLRLLMINIKRKKFPLDQVAKTLKHLTELGFIEAQASPPGSVGRPTVKYKTAKD
jgi:hypothetical protein